jgi:hypothetical protein
METKVSRAGSMGCEVGRRGGAVKQSLFILVVLFFVSATAMGQIAINWITGWGAYDHTATDLTGENNRLLDSYSAKWQLIYAGLDGIINPPDPTNAANGYVSGDDVVWATRSISQGGGTAPEDGTGWANYMGYTGGGSTVYANPSWTLNGFVYQRVYEGPPGPGSWYYDSLLYVYYVGAGPPQTFMVDSVDMGFKPNNQLAMIQTGQTTLVLQSGKQHLICYDFMGSPSIMTLNAVIGQQVPPGSQFIRMDVANQAYFPTATLDREGSWGPAGYTTFLMRGVAYWLRIPPQGGWVTSNQYSVTLTGNIPTYATTLTAAPDGRVSPLGYPYPVDKLWGTTALSTAALINSSVYFWDVSNQVFYGGTKSAKGWSSAQSNRLVKAGEGFFFRNSSANELSVIEPLP